MPAIGSGQRRGTFGGSKAIEDPHIKKGVMVQAPPKTGSPDVYPGIIILNSGAVMQGLTRQRLQVWLKLNIMADF